MNKDEIPLMKPVSLENLLRDDVTHVDLYVQLSEKKFILVAKAGTATSDLIRYRDREVHYLYLRYDDLTKLLHQSMTVAGVMLNQTHLTDASKVVALEQAMTSVYRNFENFGFNDQTVAHARVVTEATMTMCLSHTELQKLVTQMSHLKDPNHQHSLLVSGLCAMLGVAMGFTVASTLEKLALGGFLHDIGKTKLPPDIAHKPANKMTKAELEIYRSHVDTGMAMVQAIRDLPHDIALMVNEHHELADGSGYPRKIKDLLMSPMGRIISVANAFAEAVVDQDGNILASRVNAVVAEMSTVHAPLYNRDVLKALKVLVDERRILNPSRPPNKKVG